MMERYFMPPEPRGRPLNIASFSRGKRHYWGEKGKNYGFYTSGDEEDMEVRRKQHRRIKSEAYNYYSDNTLRYSNSIGSKMTLPTQMQQYAQHTYRKAVDKNYSTIAVQAGDINIERKDIGIEATPTLRQQMHTFLEKSKNQLPQEDFYLHKKPQKKLMLPQITRRGDYLKTEPNEEVKRPSVRFVDTPEVLNAQASSRSKKKEHIVYYTRKSRLNNPTFCNSVGYPLPCYRYAV